MGLQALQGIGQLIGGSRAAKRAREMEPNIGLFQQSINDQMQNVNEAQGRQIRAEGEARYGFMPAQRNQLQDQITSQMNAQGGNIRSMGGSRGQMASNMANLGLQSARAQTGLESQDAQMQMQRQQYADMLGGQLMAQRAGLNPLRQNLFSAQDSMYQQQAQAGSAMLGAGMQNLQGAIGYGADVWGKQNQAKGLQGSAAASAEGAGYSRPAPTGPPAPTQGGWPWQTVGRKDGGEIPEGDDFSDVIELLTLIQEYNV
jgi:hypothetical protein